VALVLRKLARNYRLPQMDMLAALMLVATIAFVLGWTQPDPAGKTIVAVAGPVPTSLPSPHIPGINFAWILELSSSALAIAFLGLLEALAIAKSIAAVRLIDLPSLCYVFRASNYDAGLLIAAFHRHRVFDSHWRRFVDPFIHPARGETAGSPACRHARASRPRAPCVRPAVLGHDPV
jgi:Sulfate permease family